MDNELNQLLDIFESKVKQSYEINTDMSNVLKTMIKLLLDQKQKNNRVESLVKNYPSTQSDIISFNVGGKYFSIYKSDIMKQILRKNSKHEFYGASLLQGLIGGTLDAKYDENNAIFLNRDPKYFSYILNYLRVVNTDEAFLQPNNLHDLNCLLKESEYYHIDGLTELLKDTQISHQKTQKNKVVKSKKKTILNSTGSSMSNSDEFILARVQKHSSKSPLDRKKSATKPHFTNNIHEKAEKPNVEKRPVSEASLGVDDQINTMHGETNYMKEYCTTPQKNETPESLTADKHDYLMPQRHISSNSGQKEEQLVEGLQKKRPISSNRIEKVETPVAGEDSVYPLQQFRDKAGSRLG